MTIVCDYRSCVLFPLKIFIPLYFNVLSTVPRENRLADSLYIYIYIYIYICMYVCMCIYIYIYIYIYHLICSSADRVFNSRTRVLICSGDMINN